jgi:hypothetical protein
MIAAGKRYIVYPSRSDVFEIWNLSDLHMGAKACAEDMIRRDVEAIKSNPNAYWLGGGDYCDFINYGDKRFDPDAVSESISVKDLGQLGRKSAEMVYDMFSPIRDKCLGLLYGNHELSYMKDKAMQNLHSKMCIDLNVPDLGYCCLMDLEFIRDSHKKGKVCKPLFTIENPRKEKIIGQVYEVRVFAHHGSGFATTPGGKLNKLIQFMNNFDADIYFLGHVHDQVGRRQATITADRDCKKITAHEKLGVISGSYLKTYEHGSTTYGEQKGYAPTTLGAAKITINPDKRTFQGDV